MKKRSRGLDAPRRSLLHVFREKPHGGTPVGLPGEERGCYPSLPRGIRGFRRLQNRQVQQRAWGRQEKPVTDSELAQRCARGDREAQRLLYERCSEAVYRVLCRMSPNQDEAMDLAQDTFVRVFEKVHTFDGTSSLMTWVYRIAVNEALQFRRREKRKTRIMGFLAWNRGAHPTAPADDQRRDVLEALALLPEAERVLLVLRYIEGLSYDKMAEVLEKPPGTIASGLNRARQMLRQILSADGAKEPAGTGIKQGRQFLRMAKQETPPAATRPTVSTGGNES
jgi:RNA polymerase sigma-70 factor, ECF subfamily